MCRVAIAGSISICVVRWPLRSSARPTNQVRRSRSVSTFLARRHRRGGTQTAWELRREGPLPILFGPITFYDGQGFLVARSLKARSLRDLSGTEVCVAGGTNFEFNLGAQFNSHR
jgi:hypothetical protein